MPLFNPLKPKKSLSELEEETEQLESEHRKLDAEYSVAEKRAMIAALKKRGLSPSNFKDGSGGSTWSKVWKWLKEH